MIGAAAAGLAVLAGAGFLLMRGGADKQPAASAAPAPVETVAAAEPAEPPSAEPGADFVDAFAEDAAPPAEDTAVDIEGAPLDAAALEAEGEAAAAAPPPAVAAATPAPSPTPAPPAGPLKTFRDCESCPLMASVPRGSFVMGSPEGEPGRNPYEGPQRTVSVPAFAIGVYEVTLAEWNACAADGVCQEKRGAGDSFPALGLSWRDAEGFANWLTRKTGRKYRLPTEAEWEYAARAGSTSAYWWGDRYDASKVSTREAHAVGSGAANAFGLYDVIGNAREWVADCYVNNFTAAPTDGSAVRDGDCGRRVIRGGGWSSSAADMRIANRSRIDAGGRAQYMGVRLAAAVE